MSLVAYESSDESEEDTKHLPASKNLKQKKEPVKITIPSLKEFEEENEVPIKRAKFQTGSGLFSLLPPPKNVSVFNKPGFVPNVLSSKKEQASSSLSKSYQHAKNKTVLPDTSLVVKDQDLSHHMPHENESNNENADAISSDFFSLDNVNSKNASNITHDSSDYFQSESDPNSLVIKKLENESHDLQLPPAIHPHIEIPVQNILQENVSQHQEQQQLLTEAYQEGYSLADLTDLSGSCSEFATSSDDRKSLFQDKEFLKLQGRRRESEAVNIIDVNADDQLTDKSNWLMKSLTEESTYRPSRKKHNMPTQVQKRKHQITYLAFQAKEREMDLKNQWAINSRTRRETQAKYGF